MNTYDKKKSLSLLLKAHIWVICVLIFKNECTKMHYIAAQKGHLATFSRKHSNVERVCNVVPAIFPAAILPLTDTDTGWPVIIPFLHQQTHMSAHLIWVDASKTRSPTSLPSATWAAGLPITEAPHSNCLLAFLNSHTHRGGVGIRK